MKRYIVILVSVFSSALFVGCDYDDTIETPNYVTFERNRTANVGVEIGGANTHEITVYTANVAGNDRTFDIEVGSASTLEAAGYEVPATVTVPGGSNEGTFTVEVSDVNLGLAGKKLVLNLKETSELSAGQAYTINVARTCVGKEFVINFIFDDYASEIGWSIKDANGTELVTGGGYTDSTPSASRSLCLDPGTYTFTVTDSYGDGLAEPGVITLSYAGEVLETIPGDFEEEASVEVTF